MGTSPLSFDQVFALARSAGCSVDQAIIATAIAAAESGLNPHNLGDQTLAVHGSRGLWQVFSGAWSLKSLSIKSYDELYDPAVNARCMWLISNHGKTWQPWSTYNHGSHKQYLGAASAAAARAGATPAVPVGGSVSKVVWRGYTFDARTAAMLTEVAKRCRATITPVQGSYSHGALSAGTHSGGGAVDVHVIGYSSADILQIVHVMREVGFAAWWRRSPEWTGAQHIHGIAVGCKDLDPSAAAQVVSLRNGHNGLAGNGKDRHADMHLPVITWEQYLAKRDGAPAPVPAPKPAPKPVSYVAVLGKNCRPGRIDSTTKDLQRALIATGYAKGLFSHATGLYGKGTQAAVRVFYNKHPEFQSNGKDVAIGAKGWAFLRTAAAGK